MYMMMLVLDDVAHLDRVLDAWQGAGAPGATILRSSGYQRRQEQRQQLPARYLFGAQTTARSTREQYTLIALVPDETTAQRCLQATEAITGDFSQPNTGIFTYWEVGFVKGLNTYTDEEA